jgi:hypothetical protein
MVEALELWLVHQWEQGWEHELVPELVAELGEWMVGVLALALVMVLG